MEKPSLTSHRVRLDEFVPDRSYLRGRPRAIHAVWLLVSWLFFTTHFPWPSMLKRMILRSFGADVGDSVVIKQNVYIHVPWNLVAGSHVWIGQGCTLLNFDLITLEPGSALAHEVYLAAAGHDVTSAQMAYAHKPIVIRSGAWVATRALILAGVTIEEGCVVQAGAVVTRSTPPWTVVGGVPARPIRTRELQASST